MTLGLRKVIAQSDEISEQVASTSQQLSAAEEEVTASSEEVSNTMMEVSQSANRQFNAIEISHVTMEKMLKSMVNVTYNIEKINQSSNNTVDSAQQGIASSQEAAVEEISSSSINLANMASDLRNSISTFKY